MLHGTEKKPFLHSESVSEDPTFPTYCASGPMCSSKTKNWFQIQPRLGLWCTSVSPLASLVWFLEGTLVGVWWPAPEHLWMKQRQTKKGQRQEVVGILMVVWCFAAVFLYSEVARSSHRCRSSSLQQPPPTATAGVVQRSEKNPKRRSKSKLEKLSSKGIL